MSPRELDREFHAIAEARKDDWVRRRSLAYWTAQLTRVKTLPKFERWIQTAPGRPVRAKKRASGGVQDLDQMKLAIFQMAASTKTTVTQGGKVLIGEARA